MSMWELTPWEKRQDYYNNIQLGQNVKTQTELLKNQTKAMIATQATSTNAIIISQDGIRDGIDNLSYSFDEVKEGMYGLKAAFEFGISNVVWQIEQNRQVLKSILEVLMAPLDTQAKELRRRAEDAYANGWFDEALEDFLESEKKNKYDFAVHISIGMIYLFQKVDREKAFSYFEKAAKYSKPKSQYHASLALLHAALIKRDLNLIDEAEKITAEAIELSPTFAEALYQNAQYNAQLNNVQKTLVNLEKAVKIDRNYCIKTDNDKMFDPLRKEVNELFEKLRNEAKQYCIYLYLPMEKLIKNSNDAIIANKDNLPDFSFSTMDLSDMTTLLKRLIERNSYFDCLDAQLIAKSYIKKGTEYIENIEPHINKKIEDIESVIVNESRKYRNQRDEFKKKYLKYGVGVGVFIYSIVFITGVKFSSSFLFISWQITPLLIIVIIIVIPYQLYSKKDLSQFITSKQKEINDLIALKNKIISICEKELPKNEKSFIKKGYVENTYLEKRLSKIKK